jgi:hypothetical protein
LRHFREELEGEVFSAVGVALPITSVRIFLSRGSLIIWILATVASGIVGNAAWDGLRFLVRQTIANWLSRNFGVSSVNVQVSAFVPAPLESSPTSLGPSFLAPNVVLAALALLAQATLVFAVIWLLVN